MSTSRLANHRSPSIRTALDPTGRSGTEVNSPAGYLAPGEIQLASLACGVCTAPSGNPEDRERSRQRHAADQFMSAAPPGNETVIWSPSPAPSERHYKPSGAISETTAAALSAVGYVGLGAAIGAIAMHLFMKGKGFDHG